MYQSKSFVRCNDDADIRPHPSNVCEPIHLASAEAPEFSHMELFGGIEGISSLQETTLKRVLGSFERGMNFLMGDATGVGKGRIIAALFKEWRARHGETSKGIWISASMRLKEDASNEFKNILATETDWITFTSFASLNRSQTYDTLLALLNKPSDSPVLVVVDECHMLRNKGATTNKVLDFLSSISNRVILYSSATAASSPLHLHYLERVGAWGEGAPFDNHGALVQALAAYGPSMMELMSVHMRTQGTYISRQLTFEGIRLKCVHVSLTEEQIVLYNQCAEAFFEAGIFGGSAHQTFFQRLITSFKTVRAIEEARQCVAMGKSVVISVVGTGEASSKRKNDFEYNDAQSEVSTLSRVSQITQVVDTLSLELNLPDHPINQILNAFGPRSVAELTGRIKGRQSGSWKEDRDDFQSGKKHIAIISKAGSVGISLHDQDGRPRVHIVLELPWSAEEFTQQLGRTHRSCSNFQPEFMILTSSIPAEERFTNAIIQKMRSMGALIKGDRTAGSLGSEITEAYWSALTKRVVAMQFAYATTFSIYSSKGRIPRMFRFAALEEIQAKRRTDERVLLNNALIRRASFDQRHDLSDDEKTIHALRWLAAVQTLFPDVIAPISQRWSSFTHNLFPTHSKDRVFAVLMCANSLECKSTIGLLPKDLLYLIIADVCNGEDMKDVVDLSDRISKHGMELHKFSNLTSEYILNRMMGIPIREQQALHRMLTSAKDFDEKPTVRQHDRTTCVVEMAQERVGSQIEASLFKVRRLSKESEVDVELKYTPKLPASEPGENAEFLEFGSRCVFAQGNKLCFHDKFEVPFDAMYWDALQKNGYKPSTRQVWDFRVRRHLIVLQKRCDRISNKIRIVVRQPMFSWERSMKRLVRIPTCEEYPYGLSGLLKNVSM